MSKRVRISNDSLNSYGTRILTAGIDMKQYNRNPVLLYMHERGNVIGYMKDLRVEDGEVTGEPVFDEITELSRCCKKQWEFGSLKMVSAGLDIVETSDAPEHLVAGQRRPTITKSKLYEVSIVDIGANDDAIVLRRNGELITLGKDGECLLPEIDNNNNQKTEEKMELKTIIMELGLPESATETEITARIEALKSAETENVQLRAEKEALELARVEAATDRAIAEKRVTADKKEHFLQLGKKIGAEELEATFAAMTPRVSLSGIISQQTTGPKSYNKLSDVPAAELEKMREEQPGEYARLYKAEYGVECNMEK